MFRWLLIAAGIVTAGAVIAFVAGRWRETGVARGLEEDLLEKGRRSAGTVDFSGFSGLPSPVQRYFRLVLADGQKRIRSAALRQEGSLRTSVESERWLPFTARHLAVPSAVGFLWNARVRMSRGIHVRVLDGYSGGEGSGRVSVLSAFTVASQAGIFELDSGALHRYLAEAVWYPTALLPGCGVVWSPIDDHSATASLTDSGISVSLEFHFNDVGEVTRIYTPGRFGRFDGSYRRVPWEGHFRDYEVRDGMRVPTYGEVGWLVGGSLRLVWKGQITGAHYEFSE